MAGYKPTPVRDEYHTPVQVEVVNGVPRVFLDFGDELDVDLDLGAVEELITQLQCALEIAADHMEADCV